MGSSMPIFYEITRRKREKKRKLNSILFSLIDLYFRISGLGAVFEAANKFESNNKELEKTFLDLANDDKLDTNAFKIELEKNVNELSFEDPFLAQEMSIYFRQNEMFTDDFKNKKLTSFEKKFEMMSNLCHTYLKTLEKYIIKLSEKINRKTVRKSKRFVQKNQIDSSGWEEHFSIFESLRA